MERLARIEPAIRWIVRTDRDHSLPSRLARSLRLMTSAFTTSVTTIDSDVAPIPASIAPVMTDVAIVRKAFAPVAANMTAKRLRTPAIHAVPCVRPRQLAAISPNLSSFGVAAPPVAPNVAPI
jgi:hypothetical protein